MTRSTAPSAELSGAEYGILKTVAYSSLFDYPLTASELSSGLIEARLAEAEIIDTFQKSRALQRVLGFQDGFFFLSGQENTIALRKKRERRSRRLIRRNRWILQLICALPAVRLVALSGSAAFLNTDGDGDLDLFIVTAGNRVWSCAVLILLITKLLGRRKLVCSNFLVSDQKLAIEKRDLFSANQLINLKPLAGRRCHRRLLAANPFALDFYPNASPTGNLIDFPLAAPLKLFKRIGEALLWPGPGFLLELLSRTSYRRYLQSKSERWSSPQEVVLNDDVLKLHTESHRRRVLQAYESRVAELLEKLS